MALWGTNQLMGQMINLPRQSRVLDQLFDGVIGEGFGKERDASADPCKCGNVLKCNE